MKCMKVLVHQQPYKEILRSFGLEKLFSLRWYFSSWFLLGLICLWIATLEVVLPNHTWDMIINSKPCFVIIKIKINQTLVSHFFFFKTSPLLAVFSSNIFSFSLQATPQKSLPPHPLPKEASSVDNSKMHSPLFPCSPPTTTCFTVPYSEGMSSSQTTTMGKLLMAHHTSRAAHLSPERCFPPLQKNEEKQLSRVVPK